MVRLNFEFEMITKDNYPFASLQEACSGVLDILYDKLKFDLWMVTRVEGDDWIVLAALDHGYGLDTPAVFRWSDSLCSRMVRGEGPMLAANLDGLDVYKQAPINQTVEIGAYAGVPLLNEDGSLFGTLCAINKGPLPTEVEAQEPLLKLAGRLVSSLIAKESQLAKAPKRLDPVDRARLMEEDTELLSAEGWDRMLEQEEIRSKELGHSVGAIVLLFSEIDEHSVMTISEVVHSVLRSSDVVAHVTTGVVGVMAPGAKVPDVARIIGRLKTKLADCAIDVKIGWSVKGPRSSIETAFETAMLTAQQGIQSWAA